MRTIIKEILVAFIIHIIITPCFADVNGDLNNFFNRLGYASNVSSSTAYQGQQAGYYSGGSLFLRNSVRNVQMAQADFPTVNAGCGGIDLYLGGFSFINGNGMKNLMQSILHGATGYVSELAIEQFTPQAANVMRHMQDIANKINQFNMNSCHTASQLVGAISLRTQESQINVCASAAIQQGRANSWTDAVEECHNTGQYENIMSVANGNPQYRNLIVENTNVAWKAIRNNSFLATDTQLAELLMTLSGSIIIEDGQMSYLSSLVDNKNLMNAIMNGGNAPIYRCDTTDSCLHPILSSLRISQSSALKSRVTQLLQDMVTKIETDQALTQEEIGFLQATRLPIYKILNVQAAFYGDPSILDITSYSDVIANDILYQYLRESLEAIKTSSEAMQFPPSVMGPFMKNINQALMDSRDQEMTTYKKIEVVNSLVERTQMIEQMLAGQLSSRLYNNLKWSQGID